MNSVDFCYWLQGYFEISGVQSIDERKTEIIKNHLNLVFKHEIDPKREYETVTPKEVLNKIHNGGFSNDTLIRC